MLASFSAQGENRGREWNPTELAFLPPCLSSHSNLPPSHFILGLEHKRSFFVFLRGPELSFCCGKRDLRPLLWHMGFLVAASGISFPVLVFVVA